MNIFNKFSVYTFALSLSVFALADNPGDDAVVEEQVETVVEEVVSDDAPAPVTPPADTSADDDVTVLEKVVVTGSRIKRVQQEGALPLLIITKDDIDNAGFRNVTEALQSIPSVNQYTQNESITNSFTPNANELDLRNLGPGRILFLVNGRRTADYPLPFNNAGTFVNTGTIPAGLVDRIEVLSQGASAIYGSDAISGVVNIITVKGKEFSELDVDYIEIEAGKNTQTNLTFSTGGFFGSSSWTFGVNRSEVDPMYYSDLDGFDSFADDPDKESLYTPRSGMYIRTGADYDVNAPDGGDYALGAPFLYSSSDFGVPCSTLSSSFFDFNWSEEFNVPEDFPIARGSNECGHDYGSAEYGGTSPTLINQREDTTLMATFNHTFEMGINFEARAYVYEDKAYLRSDVNRYVFLQDFYDPYRIADATDDSLNGATQTDYFSTHGYDGLTLDANGNVIASGLPESAAVVDTFYREFSADDAPLAESRSDYDEQLEDYFIGISGITESGFEWTLGVNRTNYELTLNSMEYTDAMWDYFTGVGATATSDPSGAVADVQGNAVPMANADGVLTGITGSPCGYEVIQSRYHNCFLIDRLIGEVSNDMHASWLADDSVQGLSDQTTIDFTLTGEFELMDKFIGFAFSADHQKQSYDLTPSAGRLDPNVNFVQGSTIDGDGKRSRDSVGLEFQIPVTNKLEVNIASRYDKYDDASSNVGSRRTSMASFAYRPNSKLLIRGSGSQTFRAPDMNYLFQTPSSGFIGLIDYVRCFDGVQAYVDADFFDDIGNVNNWNCAFFGSFARANFEGNPELEEEKGENYQLGLVWEINNNTTFYLDAYEVELNDAVSRESVSQLILLEGACLYGDDFKDWMVDFDFPSRDCGDVTGKVERGPQIDPFGQPFSGVGTIEAVNPDYINQSYLNYVGVDWQLRYDLETENRGDFILDIYSSHILKSSNRVDDLSKELDSLDEYIYQPRSQQNVRLTWLYQDLSVSLFSDRLGHMEIYRGQKSKPHFTTNLTVGYDYSSALDFYIGVRNIEDKMPQLDPAYGWPFYNQNYFSAIGRYISTGFNYRF